jgi:hypothetical protein
VLNCRDALRCTQMHSAALRCTQPHSDALRRTQTHSDALRRTQTHSVLSHLRHEGATSVVCGRQCPMNEGANDGEQEEQEGKGGHRVGHQRKVQHGPERIRSVCIEKAMVTVDARRDHAIRGKEHAISRHQLKTLDGTMQPEAFSMQAAGIT